MSTLVTGGGGLIGMAVRSLLRARGEPVLAVDLTRHGRNDPALHEIGLQEPERLLALAQAHGVRAIVHCGAISGPMLAKGQPFAMVEANISGTAAMLELARALHVRRFVFCSSISVYGDAGPAVLDEARAPCPSSVYAASKAAGEALVQAYAAEYAVEGVSLRIGRVYGPYRRANCVLKAIIEDAHAGQVTVIPCQRDFPYHYVWVGDVADAVAACLEAPALPARIYNVGSGEALTMPKIVEIATAALSGSQVTMVPGEDDVPDVQTHFPVARIAADLGFRPRYGLAQGLRAYAAGLPEPVDIG
jgi:UDP-glucuronate 4-epimerase